MQMLENRVAIVTGGTGALGRAVVENFLIAGAKAAVPYVVDAEVPLLQKQLGNRFPASEIFLKRADVSDEAQTAKFVADVASKWGKIDILVNLVGGFWGGKSIAETTLAEWQAMFDLNVKPTFLCCRAVVPIMQRNKWGRIVSVASRSGLQGRRRLRGLRDREGRDRDVHRVARAGSARRRRDGQCDRAEHHRHGSESRRDAEGEARKLGEARGYRENDRVPMLGRLPRHVRRGRPGLRTRLSARASPLWPRRPTTPALLLERRGSIAYGASNRL